MKKYIIIGGIIVLTIIAGIALFSTTQTLPQDTSNKPKIAATIFPIYDLTRQVAGDDMSAQLILPPGTSPHFFEPTPSLLRELSGTEILFTIDHGLDAWAESIAANIGNPKIVPVDTYAHLHESTEEHEEHEDEDEEHDEHGHGPTDPHYWLDPTNAIGIVDTIVEELSTLDPENTVAYTNRGKNLQKMIREQDALWQQEIDALQRKEIVTFHDAFGYFADHFGLHIVASFEPFPGKKPTAGDLQKLQEAIEEHRISSLFLEPQMSRENLETFAKDNNIRLGVLDPIGGTQESPTYIDLLSYNVSVVVNAIK